MGKPPKMEKPLLTLAHAKFLKAELASVSGDIDRMNSAMQDAQDRFQCNMRSLSATVWALQRQIAEWVKVLDVPTPLDVTDALTRADLLGLVIPKGIMDIFKRHRPAVKRFLKQIKRPGVVEYIDMIKRGAFIEARYALTKAHCGFGTDDDPDGYGRIEVWYTDPDGKHRPRRIDLAMADRLVPGKAAKRAERTVKRAHDLYRSNHPIKES